jgi:hypothetical protein
MECRLCGDRDLRREFEGSIRAGTHGKYTPHDVQVIFCGACQVAFLNPFEVIEYENGSYRLDYNQTEDLKA